jgi:SH3 domain protein
MLKKTLGIILALALLPMASPARAEKMYVVDELVITIRQSKSVSGSVVGRAKSLDKVTVLEADENWAKIKTEGGAEGWVQKRYLSDTPPDGVKLNQIQEENQRLSAQFQSLEEENQRLKYMSDELEKKLADEKTARSKLEEDYRKLGDNAADYLVLKKEYEEARDQLTRVKAESEKLKRAADETVNARRIKWFIAGGAVLLVGWLVGIISARRKKSQSRLY